MPLGLIKDTNTYSYSQLNSFDECPYSFYLQRIEKVPEQLSNAFAERGSLIHDLLDKWAKGILKKEDMISEYERRYSDEVVTAFPPMMKNQAEKAYNQGIEFLENFDEFPGYKVVSAEEKFTIDLPLTDGTTRKFTGIVDLILRKEWTNELIVCDHKSKSMDSFKKAEDEMYRQQLLYSQYVYEKYGEWPSALMFHLFGDLGSKPQRAFEMKQFREALDWATDCIHKIEGFTALDWLENKDSSDFYCHELCNVRRYCGRSVEKPLSKREKEELRACREAEMNSPSFITEDEELNEKTVVAQSKETEEELTQPERVATENSTAKTLKCENCGAPHVPRKRKCPHCGSPYNARKKT